MSTPSDPPPPSSPRPESGGTGQPGGAPLWGTPAPAGPQRSAVGIGILVGVLVFAVALVGFVGWRVLDDDDGAPVSSPTGSTTPSPSAPASSPAPTDDPSTDPRLASFYGQKLTWKRCARSHCTKLRVPLDYADPGGKAIELAVLRVPAQDRDERIGALVVNPGGPGGSGVQFASYGSLQFGNELSDRFDIVGFDPRGVAASAPLRCVDDAELDEILGADPDPDDQAERDELDRLVAGFGAGCLSESGDLARHMSTKEVVQDMDILRAALGEKKLDYLGSSYGTYIGALYADMFPDRVGRFVLDGALDPSLSNEQLALQQAGGFETALRAYVADCVKDGGCVLGDSVDAGVARIRQFLDAVDRKPLPTSDERELTEGWATIGVWLPLYVKEYWPMLTRALEQAIQDGRGTALLALADQYASREAGGYKDNSMEALYAVNCLDHNDFIATKDVPSRFALFEKTSPTFGRAFAYSLSTCASWPVKSGNKTVALDAAGAPPIVVIGTTRDPATPLRWAQALAAQLDSGRLITRDGDGHTGFQRGNDCVDDAVEDFLIDGDVPRDDLKC